MKYFPDKTQPWVYIIEFLIFGGVQPNKECPWTNLENVILHEKFELYIILLVAAIVNRIIRAFDMPVYLHSICERKLNNQIGCNLLQRSTL